MRAVILLSVLALVGCKERPSIYDQPIVPYDAEQGLTAYQLERLRAECQEARWRDNVGCAEDVVMLAQYYRRRAEQVVRDTPFGLPGVAAPDLPTVADAIDQSRQLESSRF